MHISRPKAGRFCFVLLLVLVLAPAAFPAPEPAFPVTLHDALGRTVTIPARPQRIISLAPSVTEVLFAIGLDQEVVGISAADDYPPAKIRSRERIGGVQLNFEAIVGLRPDLIIGMPSLQQPGLERLIRLGLPVLAVDAANMDGVFEKILQIGRATGQRRRATLLAAEMRLRAATIARRAGQARAKPRVYVEIWGEPLITAASGTFIDDLIGRAGGINVFGDLTGWPQVSAEAILVRNPEVIILTYPNRAAVLVRRSWRQIAAVRHGRVYEVEPSLISRPGPRIVEGLLALARLLHPAVFNDDSAAR